MSVIWQYINSYLIPCDVDTSSSLDSATPPREDYVQVMIQIRNDNLYRNQVVSNFDAASYKEVVLMLINCLLFLLFFFFLVLVWLFCCKVLVNHSC